MSKIHQKDPGIAMLGTMGSGKSTFLGALRIALLRKAQRDADQAWRIWCRESASLEALVEMDRALNSQGKLPLPTEGIDQFDWILDGKVGRKEKMGRFGTRSFSERVEVTLKLTDPSGELYRSDHMSHEGRQRLIDHVVGSQGILYMFDPIQEHQEGDAYETTSNTIMQVVAAMADNPDFDGRLPHHVAVCVTKLDDPRVFKTAESLRLLEPDPHHPLGFPRVHDTDAKDLLQSLCRVGRNGSGDVLPQLLETYFYPERITYYVTSAVGFMLNKRTRRFDKADTENVYRGAKGKPLVRGPVNPINVVEPVLWLVDQLALSA